MHGRPLWIGEVVLWESMAINLYFAQKREGTMHCGGPEV
jgi:glutathione S-transferase